MSAYRTKVADPARVINTKDILQSTYLRKAKHL